MAEEDMNALHMRLHTMEQYMQGQQEQLDNALIMLQQLTQAMARGRGKYNDFFLLFWVGGGLRNVHHGAVHAGPAGAAR